MKEKKKQNNQCVRWHLLSDLLEYINLFIDRHDPTQETNMGVCGVRVRVCVYVCVCVLVSVCVYLCAFVCVYKCVGVY